MNRDNMLQDQLTAVRVEGAVRISQASKQYSCGVGREFVLLRRVPLASKLSATDYLWQWRQGVQRKLVWACADELEKIYPGSPIPGEVARRVLRQQHRNAQGRAEMLERLRKDVRTYQAILALSACPVLEQTLSQQLAICRGSSGYPDQSAS
jgi:hypothetical protein